MKIYRILGQKGRTTIPLPIRECLEIEDNDVLLFEVNENGEIVITPQYINSEKCEEFEELEDFEEYNNEDIFDVINSLTPQEKQDLLIHILKSI